MQIRANIQKNVVCHTLSLPLGEGGPLAVDEVLVFSTAVAKRCLACHPERREVYPKTQSQTRDICNSERNPRFRDDTPDRRRLRRERLIRLAVTLYLLDTFPHRGRLQGMGARFNKAKQRKSAPTKNEAV